MILQIVDNTVLLDKRQEYIAAAKDFAADSSQNDAGCAGMSVWGDETRPEHVYIISRWEDEASMQASVTFLKYKARLKPCFVGNATTILVQA